MHFIAASVALFAGLAAAMPQMETVYTTEDVTVYSCAPTVTNCPARSTTPVGVSPASSTPVSSVPVIPSAPASSGNVPPSSPAGQPTAPAQSPSVIPITTCIPTVIYSTVTPVAPATSSVPVIPQAPSGVSPSGSASPSSPVFTGAASSNGHNIAVAGAVAAAAFFLA